MGKNHQKRLILPEIQQKMKFWSRKRWFWSGDLLGGFSVPDCGGESPIRFLFGRQLLSGGSSEGRFHAVVVRGFFGGGFGSGSAARGRSSAVSAKKFFVGFGLGTPSIPEFLALIWFAETPEKPGLPTAIFCGHFFGWIQEPEGSQGRRPSVLGRRNRVIARQFFRS